MKNYFCMFLILCIFITPLQITATTSSTTETTPPIHILGLYSVTISPQYGNFLSFYVIISEQSNISTPVNTRYGVFTNYKKIMYNITQGNIISNWTELYDQNNFLFYSFVNMSSRLSFDYYTTPAVVNNSVLYFDWTEINIGNAASPMYGGQMMETINPSAIKDFTVPTDNGNQNWQVAGINRTIYYHTINGVIPSNQNKVAMSYTNYFTPNGTLLQHNEYDSYIKGNVVITAIHLYSNKWISSTTTSKSASFDTIFSIFIALPLIGFVKMKKR